MTMTLTPPGPNGRLLLGHLPELRRDWLGCLTRYAREYGDFVPLRIGPRRAVLLNDPSSIEHVMVTDPMGFVKSPILRNGRRLLGNGLVTNEGEGWRRQRRLAQPAFHNRRIAAYGQTMVATAERMLAGWPDGDVRDVHAEMMSLTLEIVARTLFDADGHLGVAAAVPAGLGDLAPGAPAVRDRRPPDRPRHGPADEPVGAPP